jgi:toxin ParE1/3/4
MRAIVFSPVAPQDVTQLWEYVAERNPRAAEALLDQIDRDVHRLALMPGIGHKRRDVQDKRYRFWIVARSFVLAYRFDEDTLTVVRVLHGARDFRWRLGSG